MLKRKSNPPHTDRETDQITTSASCRPHPISQSSGDHVAKMFAGSQEKPQGMFFRGLEALPTYNTYT